jgi:molybdate transport system regulatory protein
MKPRRPTTPRLVASVRILDARGERVFGEGIATLLGEIERAGSIAEAARAMGMAYSKAWRIIRNLERALGVPALTREKGGRSRGGAVLTPKARDLLRIYRTIFKSVHGRLASPAAKELLHLFS